MFQWLSKWFNEKPYTKAMYLTAAATLAMAVTSGIMCFTIRQNTKSLRLAEESIRLTRDALVLQKTDFELRNRPVVDIVEVTFNEASRSDSMGRQYQHSVALGFANFAEIAATDVRLNCRSKINGVKRGDHTLGPMGFLPKDKIWWTYALLPEDLYAEATNQTNIFTLEIDLLYEGMSGPGEKKYSHVVIAEYEPRLGQFGLLKSGAGKERVSAELAPSPQTHGKAAQEVRRLKQ